MRRIDGLAGIVALLVGASGAGAVACVFNADLTDCSQYPHAGCQGYGTGGGTTVDAGKDCPAPGLTCVPAAPAGWTLVTFTPSSQPPCPQGYGVATTLRQLPVPSSGPCTCSCGAPQKNPCLVGTLSVQFGHTACGGTQIDVPTDGKCDALGQKIGLVGTPYTDCRANVVPPIQVACDAAAILPALVMGGTGRACTPIAPGGGCSAGATCLPQVPPGEQCLQASGDMPCPGPDGSFTHRYVVYSPSSLHDGRSCGACSCSSKATACVNASLTTYSTADCSNMGTPVTVNGACNMFPVGSNDQYDDHFIYTAMPDTMVCGAASPTTPVSGQVTASNPVTVCCP